MSLTSPFSIRLRNVIQRAVRNVRSLHSQNLHPPRPEQPDDDLSLKEGLRKLFRHIAQPVAVVTSFMPNSPGTTYGTTLSPKTKPENATTMLQTSEFHGATLSSFTSVAMDPHPLVIFALRIPSRMATTLSSLPASAQAHMVVNLLSADQASTAVIFSRPDLHPAPFESSDVRYRLSNEGLPVLEGVVGALSCKLVRRGIPLYDLDNLGAGKGFAGEDSPQDVLLQEGYVASELFIARVVRVETRADDRTLPLVYHQRTYTTCSPKH